MLVTVCLALLAFVGTCSAFQAPSFQTKYMSSRFQLPAVSEINSIADLDAAVKGAGDKLLVVDYSTTWCGPCKIVLPKYVALSEKYPGVAFYKCVGDLSLDGGALMKAQGVRSVPAFHFWKDGSKVSLT